MKKAGLNGFEFELSTGRVFYAHQYLLCPNDGPTKWGDWPVHEGYDSTAYVKGGDFTPEEKREIADFFIERWNAWAAWRGP